MIADAWQDLDFKELSPLCVDLDGTLITTDVLYVSWCNLAQRNMFQVLWVMLCIFKGRAYFKKQLAEASPIDPSTLTYHAELLAFLKAYKQQHAGLLVLATATNKAFAQAVADYLGIFDQVIASDGHMNLRAQCKADILSLYFGYKKFTYVGNSYDDIAVWDCSKKAIAVNLSLRARCALMRKKIHFDLVFENNV